MRRTDPDRRCRRHRTTAFSCSSRARR